MIANIWEEWKSNTLLRAWILDIMRMACLIAMYECAAHRKQGGHAVLYGFLTFVFTLMLNAIYIQ